MTIRKQETTLLRLPAITVQIIFAANVKRPAKREKAKSPKSPVSQAFRGFLTKDTNGEKTHRADTKPYFVRKI